MTGLAQRLGLTLTPRAATILHSYLREGSAHDTPSEDMATDAAALTQLQADTGAVVIQPMTLTQYLASGRVLRARTALIALPLNADAQIRFTPPLAHPLQTLRQHGPAGRALKRLIRAQGPRPGHLAAGETASLRCPWPY